jgi:hypothetical protein
VAITAAPVRLGWREQNDPKFQPRELICSLNLGSKCISGWGILSILKK